MSDDLKKNVLAALSKVGRSSNEISKACDFGKTNPRVTKILDELVSDGAATSTRHERGWMLYSKSKKAVGRTTSVVKDTDANIDSEISKLIMDELDGATEPLSASALSTACGFSKAKRIRVTLDAMVANGTVTKDEKGTYPVYSTGDTNGGDDGGDDGGDAGTVTVSSERRRLPVDNRGYKIDDTDDGWQITAPNGDVLQCEFDEALVVINDDPYAFVKCKDEVLKAAIDYSEEEGIRTYTLKDSVTGKAINKVDDIDEEPVIIFMSLTRHNKAGR